MKHIRFLSSAKAVCEEPSLLEEDFVVSDIGEGRSCQACLKLIALHNELCNLLDAVPAKDLRTKRHEFANFMVCSALIVILVILAVMTWLR